jgi:hypothetical protein
MRADQSQHAAQYQPFANDGFKGSDPSGLHISPWMFGIALERQPSSSRVDLPLVASTMLPARPRS